MINRTMKLIGVIAGSALLAATPVVAQSAKDRELQQQIVNELNAARTDPQDYIPKLVTYRSTIKGRYAYRPVAGEHGPSTVRTRLSEGVAAVDDAIGFLKRQTPIARVASDPKLIEAARRFADEQSRTGKWGHVSANGSDLTARIAQDGTRKRFNAETIMYGKSTAQDIVMHLIIDDGVRDRSHRGVIFDDQLRLVGSICRPHPKWMICVSEYSSNEPDAMPPQARR